MSGVREKKKGWGSWKGKGWIILNMGLEVWRKRCFEGCGVGKRERIGKEKWRMERKENGWGG